MKLSQAKKDHIEKEEVKRKFYDKFKHLDEKITSKINDLIKKSVPNYITDKLVESGYIKRSNLVRFSNINEDEHEEIFSALYNMSKNVIKKRRHSSYITVDTHFPCNKSNHDIKASKELINLLEKKAKLIEDREKFRSKIKAVLYSFNTDKQLLESIPEFKKYFTDSNAFLPIGANDIKDLRAMISA